MTSGQDHSDQCNRYLSKYRYSTSYSFQTEQSSRGALCHQFTPTSSIDWQFESLQSNWLKKEEERNIIACLNRNSVKSNHQTHPMRMHHLDPEHQGACMCPRSAGYGSKLIRATPSGPLTFCLDRGSAATPQRCC
jgi:hypothetical protein